MGLSCNFVHQMCHWGGWEGGGRGKGRGGGGWALSQILPKTLAGYISVIRCAIALKFSQCVGHTKDSVYAKSQLYILEVMVI